MCFWKTLHLILMHFIHIFQCLEEFMHKTGLFFKTVFFLEFRSIEAVFRSIEIVLKILMKPLYVSINRNWFLINQKAWIRFFKKLSLTCSNLLFKSFSNFSLSLSDLDKAHHQFFVVFLRYFSKVFLSLSR